jgi:hypothetical protein
MERASSNTGLAWLEQLNGYRFLSVRAAKSVDGVALRSAGSRVKSLVTV